VRAVILSDASPGELNLPDSSLTFIELDEKSENEIFGDVKYLDLDLTFWWCTSELPSESEF
jgi:hypothetical protein